MRAGNGDHEADLNRCKDKYQHLKEGMIRTNKKIENNIGMPFCLRNTA
jgi:hypothetical protein